MTANDSPNETEASSAVDANLARHGKVAYLQIPAVDVDGSGRFYASVFGWSIRADTNPAHRSFTDASGDLIGAFVIDLAVSRQPGVLPYVYVTKIDNTIRQIEAGGGKIVKQPYLEGDLWVATFRDPAGNLMGIWQAAPR
jgi:predicted enzyme related to lactoylglutathione lyase